VLGGIAARMNEVGLRLHPDKTRIVYCRDGRRRTEHVHTSLTFLRYAFRARGARSKNGVNFTGFLPAISPEALKARSARLRELRIHQRTDLSLEDLARWLNPIIAGWIRYYGRFYRTALDPFLRRINTYLRRLPGESTNDCGLINASAGGGPGCSHENPAYSPIGASSAPTADQKSPVTGDCHAGIRGSRGLQRPSPPDTVLSSFPRMPYSFLRGSLHGIRALCGETRLPAPGPGYPPSDREQDSRWTETSEIPGAPSRRRTRRQRNRGSAAKSA
jgi:hypothetical protein